MALSEGKLETAAYQAHASVSNQRVTVNAGELGFLFVAAVCEDPASINAACRHRRQLEDVSVDNGSS